MRISAVILAGILSVGSPSEAQDYKAEIVEEVIDPCFLEIVRANGEIPGGSQSDLLELAKLAMPVSITDAIISSVRNMVEGRNREFRTLVYKIARNECIHGGRKGAQGG